MKVVFVTNELATNKNTSGGLASFTANMARMFAQNGHQVTIILSTLKETELTFDENILVINSYMPKKIWERYNRIAKVLTFFNKKYNDEFRRTICNMYRSHRLNRKINKLYKNGEVDLVHFCNLTSAPLFASKKIPHVVRMSSLESLCRGADLPIAKYGYNEIPLLLTEKLHDYALRKQPYVISPSNWIAEEVKKNINTNVRVIESPFCFNENEWDYTIYNQIIKGKRYVLYYGSLKYLKGTNTIAQLVKRLLEQNQEIYLVLAGKSQPMLDADGNYIKASELVEKCAGEYGDRVISVDALVREQLYPLVEGAELCVFPSRLENLSNACIESLAMGKIVVSTEGVSYEQLIEDNVNGFLCERDNADSFLQGITKGLNLTDEEKKIMSKNARESVERLKSEKVYLNFLEYYEEVIKEWK